MTRDGLLDGSLLREFAACAPALRLLTEEERAASLARTLAQRPPGDGGVWLFAYGSLIWNPALRYDDRRVARIQGWHRRFCLSTIAGRGTQDAPGLVLGLDRGGACTGAAFHVAEALVAEELTLLWRREMLSGSYAPRWMRLRDQAGAPFAHGIGFVIDRAGPYYAGALAEEETVRRLATARGNLGSSAEYLLRTRDGLRLLGINDPHVERLARQVELAQAREGNV